MMSTLDQKLAAQNGQAVAFANNAAVALSRQAAERQRQLAQELRAPVIVETPMEHADKKPPTGGVERLRHASPAEHNEEGDKLAEGHPSDARRIDVRI